MILRDRDMRNRAITVMVIILIFLGAYIRMNTRLTVFPVILIRTGRPES